MTHSDTVYTANWKSSFKSAGNTPKCLGDLGVAPTVQNTELFKGRNHALASHLASWLQKQAV